MTRQKVNPPIPTTAAAAPGFDRSPMGRTLRAIEADLAEGMMDDQLPNFDHQIDVLQVLPRARDYFVFWHLSSQTISRASAALAPGTSSQLVLRFYLELLTGENRTITTPIDRWQDTTTFVPTTPITGISAALGLDCGSEYIVLLQATPLQAMRTEPAAGRLVRSEQKVNVFGVRSIETVAWSPPDRANGWQIQGLPRRVQPLIPGGNVVGRSSKLRSRK
ncbi:MAG: hypothetical protein VX589_14790 [Myxococcota bacterium]|nr:hypothetical protein [Myxococcota bacterium]